MSKFTDEVKATLQGYFNLGDVPTEAQYAEVFERIQEAIQEHEHVASGGPGSGTGDAGPIPDATEDASGVVELATVEEAHAGTDTTRAVTPAGLLMREVDTAILGGDLTGNARGAGALDIQSTRDQATQVASGDQAVAIGNFCTAGDYSTAVGHQCNAPAERSTAIGHGAKTEVPTTTNICGPQIIRKDRGESSDSAFYTFCGAEVILMSKEVDFTTVADQTITLPAGCKFWLDEIGIIATQIEDLTTQPTIRFGITGDLDKHLAATLTTKLTAAGKREKFVPLVPEDGENSLNSVFREFTSRG